jgi:hypothetical protein
MMRRPYGVVLVLAAVVSCRSYNLESRLADQPGLVPPDQFARYGREQAEEMAIAREFGAAIDGASPENLMASAEAATRYALTLPDIADVRPDPLGLRLTLQFKSGWRTMVVPIKDGKRGAETPGLPGGPAPNPKR